MRKRFLRLFVLLVVAASSLYVAPPTAAQPRDWVYIVYYDCSWNVVGESWLECNGVWYHNGSQSGSYREIISEQCSGMGDPEYVVQQWNNGTWETWNGGETFLCRCTRLGYC